MIIQQPPAFCASPTRSVPTLTATPDEQTKQELVALSEQRMNQINKRTHDVEERLSVREQELAKTKQQFAQLTQDFRYNLKLLEDRDAELERLDASIVTHRAAAEKADNALQQQKNLVTEREAEVRREKSRIAELEAYYKEKVERLAKQTDDARNSKDEELQKQKDDFLVLERQLVRQLEEQKTLLEAQRADMHAQVAERGKRAEEEAKEPIALLQAELHQEKAQSLALAGELEAAQGMNQGFKDEIQAAVDDKREAEREAADCRERVVAVEELLESMRGELDAVKEFNATEKAAEVEADAEAINAQREKERTLATTVQDQKDEIAELSKKVKELEASLETAAESVKKAEEDAKAAAEQAEAANAAAETMKAKAEEEAKKPPEPEPAADQVPATPAYLPEPTSANLLAPPPSIGREKPEVAAAAAGAAAARAVMQQGTGAHWDSSVEQMWGRSISISSAGPDSMVPMEAVEAAAKAAVEAALATRIPTTVTISAPSSPVQQHGIPSQQRVSVFGPGSQTNTNTVGDLFTVAEGSNNSSSTRARLLAAKDAIETVGSAPPEVERAVQEKKRRKKRAKAPSRPSSASSALSRSTIEERQARQLSAMQAHVDAITAARRERAHVSRLRNYWV